MVSYLHQPTATTNQVELTIVNSGPAWFPPAEIPSYFRGTIKTTSSAPFRTFIRPFSPLKITTIYYPTSLIPTSPQIPILPAILRQRSTISPPYQEQPTPLPLLRFCSGTSHYNHTKHSPSSTLNPLHHHYLCHPARFPPDLPSIYHPPRIPLSPDSAKNHKKQFHFSSSHPALSHEWQRMIIRIPEHYHFYHTP